MNTKTKRFSRPLILALILAVGVTCATGWLLYTLAAKAYTIASLNWARGQGIYNTPQEGVIARANQYYCELEKVEIEHAATNSFDGSDPHIWYVIFTVHAQNRIPCDSENPGPLLHRGTSESGGSFYLHTKDGWVWMPEGRFPELIGHWMKKLDLAGPGDPTHIPRGPASLNFRFLFLPGL